jgi:erythromycin esterase
MVKRYWKWPAAAVVVILLRWIGLWVYDRSREPTEGQLQWLKNEVLPFKTPDAGHGFDDLLPFKAVVGTARIVALGEATHGTSEFFRFKHRMLEFLASEMGFTIFAIEDDMPEAEQIDDFIQTGTRDPKALVLKLFPVWQTQEVLDLVLWMRRFNESGKGRLHFAGFDMQNELGAQRIVADFVKKHVPDEVKNLAHAYDGAPGDIGRAEEVLQHLENNRERLLKSVDHGLIERAVENARVVVQNRKCFSGGGGPPYRDRCMAENIDWLLEQAGPNAKMVVWAHNAHVARKANAMGSHLARRHSSEMVVFGLTCHDGSFTNAPPNEPRAVTALWRSTPGSAEWFFHRVGASRCILDLRKASPASPQSGWLARPVDFRLAWTFEPVSLQEAFDVIVFFDQTTPSNFRGLLGP